MHVDICNTLHIHIAKVYTSVNVQWGIIMLSPICKSQSVCCMPNHLLVYIGNDNPWWDDKAPSWGNHKDAYVVGSICVCGMCESDSFI